MKTILISPAGQYNTRQHKTRQEDILLEERCTCRTCFRPWTSVL